MSKHTPGPWLADFDHRDIWEVRKGPVMLGQVWRFDGAGDELPAEANARLIAAAPDLLACLIEFVQCVDGEHTLEMYHRARAAIVKAEAK